MVKEVVLRHVFPGVTVKEQHMQCSGPENMIAYHRQLHNNDDIVVGEWEPVGEAGDPSPTLRRHVCMWQPFDAPYIVRKVTATESMKLEDDHIARFDHGTGNICQTSNPLIHLPGLGDLQVCSMEWRFENILDDRGVPGVQVTAKVSADADELKWLALLRSPLEKIFVSESIKAVEGFFKHTGQKLAEYVRLRDSGNPPPHTAPWPLDPAEPAAALDLATPPTSPGRRSADGGSSILDTLYFDAPEDVQDGAPLRDSNDPPESQFKAGPVAGDRTPIKEEVLHSDVQIIKPAGIVLVPQTDTSSCSADAAVKKGNKGSIKHVVKSIKRKLSSKAK